MPGNQRTGRAYIYINGTLYESGDDAKLSNYLGIEREAVVGAEVYGFSEKPVAPTIVCSLIHGGGLRLTDLKKLTDVTVTFRCDTGEVYVLKNGWVAKADDFTAKDGKAPVTFMGKSVEPI
jgi:hypothetical protein